MLLHPDAQERARSAIDEVVGLDRLPTLEDQKALPYLTALMKEILRCASALSPFNSDNNGSKDGVR